MYAAMSGTDHGTPGASFKLAKTSAFRGSVPASITSSPTPTALSTTSTDAGRPLPRLEAVVQVQDAERAALVVDHDERRDRARGAVLHDAHGARDQRVGSDRRRRPRHHVGGLQPPRVGLLEQDAL